MGYQLSKEKMESIFKTLQETHDIYAPVVKKGDGTFSEVDVVRYDKVTSFDEIEWNKKSDYSFKEALLSINETLFYFTEDETTVPKGPTKDLLIFLRACDMHALKRLDQIYLDNKFGDFYYQRVRARAKFCLMGCEHSCDSGYCVAMGTNKADDYDLYLKLDGDKALVDAKNEDFVAIFNEESKLDVTPDYVTENKQKVSIPKNLSKATKDNPIWEEYGSRCIGCGRCNFVCPTCTCFTMQDIFYKDNPKVGERRRVWASCQIDGYSQIAGGFEFRKSQADRIRFKVMHKHYDFEKRFGYSMCVGCGRCDDVCPEYISHAAILNRLAKEEG